MNMNNNMETKYITIVVKEMMVARGIHYTN